MNIRSTSGINGSLTNHSLICGWKALLLCCVALLATAVLPSRANAQQVVINIGTPPPVCPYGYYDYAPYACAPVGFYGPGYFYNGIFLGVGPWYHWGYGHGWGRHRFIDPRGGRYFDDGRGRYYGRGHAYGHYKHRGRPMYDDDDHEEHGEYHGDHGHGGGHGHR